MIQLDPTPADRDRFLAEISPVAAAICPLYGIDPAICIQTAATASRWGIAAAHHNYWQIGGRGDGGSFLTLRGRFHGRTDGGGWEPAVTRLARFRSPASAVTAWCRAIYTEQRRQRG